MESLAGLPPEREKEIIEKLANRIVNSGLGTMAIMTLESVAPLSFIGAQAGMVLASPVFMTLDLLGVKVYEYVGLFSESSRSRENMKKLINRIEQLMKKADEAQRREREASKGRQTGWLKRLRVLLS